MPKKKPLTKKQLEELASKRKIYNKKNKWNIEKEKEEEERRKQEELRLKREEEERIKCNLYNI